MNDIGLNLYGNYFLIIGSNFRTLFKCTKCFTGRRLSGVGRKERRGELRGARIEGRERRGESIAEERWVMVWRGDWTVG